MGGWRRVGARKVGAPKGGGSKGGGSKGGGPKGGGPKISLFFFPVPPQNSFFSPLWGSSRGILVVFEAPGRSNVHVWSPRAQTCTFEGPGLQKHHQYSTRRPPEREKKNEFCGGRGKKRAKFWAVQGKGGPGKGGPGKGGPGKGGPGGTEHDQTKTLKPPHGNRETNTHATQAHTSTHKHTQTHTNTHTNTHKHKSKSVWPKSVWPKSVWPKSVLAKVGIPLKH